MTKRKLSYKKYKDKFLEDKEINAQALQQALEMRKYEIEYYWKRATYFWTFIAATLAGFIAIQTSTSPQTDLSVLLCTLGIVFSFAWYCVNRGSKYWQENWENHVNMLEDKFTGSIYKVVLSRPKAKGINKIFAHIVTGPSPISVSKINHIISLYITIIWIGLLFYSLPPFRMDASINFYYVFLILLAILTCIGFLTVAKTHNGDYEHEATIKKSRII